MSASNQVTLVLGGARSGKSAVAQRIAGACGGPVLYVATAEASDEEIAARIERHRAERPAAWRTLEAPRGLPEAVAAAAAPRETVLIDCASVWLSNELLAIAGGVEGDTVPASLAIEIEARLLADTDRLAVWAQARPGATVIVSNEVGAGVVPAFALGRLYRDVLGRANQRLAAAAGSVLLVVAGIPLDLRRFEAV